MAVLDQITKAQESTFDRIKDGNENLVSFSKSAQKTARKTVKTMPKRISKRVPALDKVPAPREMVNTYFDFAGRSLELNRDLVTNVVDAWAPKAPARKARKTTRK